MNTAIAAAVHPSRVSTLTSIAPENWALLAFVVLIPLQNLYTGYWPNLGGGLNFLNLMFVAALLMAWRCGGRLVRGSGLNGWVWTYIGASVVALLVSFAHVHDSSGHVNILKDQLIAVAFVFLAQMSATDSSAVRRLLWCSLLPLPYMLWVVVDQHTAVVSWHYSHDMRIAGTFSDLGANELAAFFTTSSLVSLGLLLGMRCNARWRAILLLAIGCSAIGIALTYSRTAYIAVLGGAMLVALLRRGGARLLVPMLIATLLLPILLPLSVLERFSSITVAEGQRDESTAKRFEFWEVARKNFGEHPLLGTGFHSFQHAEINPQQRDTHNLYLRELTEKGLLGGLVLAGLFLCTGRFLWRSVRGAERGGLTYGLALGLSGAFAALLCNNLFGDRFTHYPMIAHYWLYLGLLLRSAALDAQGP